MVAFWLFCCSALFILQRPWLSLIATIRKVWRAQKDRSSNKSESNGVIFLQDEAKKINYLYTSGSFSHPAKAIKRLTTKVEKSLRDGRVTCSTRAVTSLASFRCPALARFRGRGQSVPDCV